MSPESIFANFAFYFYISFKILDTMYFTLNSKNARRITDTAKRNISERKR